MQELSVRYMRSGLWVALLAYVAFGVLDWTLFEGDVLQKILLIRGACVVLLLLVLGLVWLRPSGVQPWTQPIAFVVSFVGAAAIAVMTWFLQGYSSPYYAGICLVILAAGLLFRMWPCWIILLNGAIYLFYMAPLALGLIPMGNPHTFLTHQFFLVGTIIISVFVQLLRFKAEKHELSLKLALEELAITDELTHLHNRRHFFKRGSEEYARARRYKRDLAAIMVDVDFFKRVNDTFGHAVGDEVLRAVARQLQASLRSQDLLGRYGGEEFAVLMPETDLRSAVDIVGQRICESIAHVPILTSKGAVHVTVSVGVACLGDGMQDLSALLTRADEALYSAKRTGRNRVVSVA
jgi:diguanylate cyclase (GGDEF)-like protein